MRRGTLSSFPAARAPQVLAHVERRCRANCPYCRAEREADRRAKRIAEALEDSLRLITQCNEENER